MKIKTTVETDLSYLDILAKLKEDINSDSCMPKADHDGDFKKNQNFLVLKKHLSVICLKNTK